MKNNFDNFQNGLKLNLRKFNLSNLKQILNGFWVSLKCLIDSLSTKSPEMFSRPTFI